MLFSGSDRYASRGGFLVGFVVGQEYIKGIEAEISIYFSGRMFWTIACFAKLPVER